MFFNRAHRYENGKRNITNIAGVGLATRAKNPKEIFLEMKDDGHPLKLVRGQLCIIGGNWISDEAKTDRGPFSTMKREWREELSLDRKERNLEELVHLGYPANVLSGAKYAQATNKQATDGDRERLKEVVEAILERFTPFGTFSCNVTKKAILTADPTSKKDGFTALSCVWVASLEEDLWQELALLQEEYFNISNETLSFMTSLDDMIERNQYGAFGYDRVLQKYFGAMGYPQAKSLPLVPHIEVAEEGAAFATFEEYIEKFNVERTPFVKK